MVIPAIFNLRAIAVAGLAIVALASTPLRAQPATSPETQALGECLVAKTTGADRIALARWIGAAMLSGPQLADLGKIDPAKRDAVDRGTAAIFTRLVTKDCATQARPALKMGSAAMETAFEALGRVAMQELMGNREASTAFTSFTKYIRDEDFAALRSAK